jgi:protein TonB
MNRYRGTAETPDKAKAVAAVLLVHMVLAAVILSGLNVRFVERAVERLNTFDVALPEPPPPPPPPAAARKADRAVADEGAAGKKAEPTPIVAPEPRIEIPAEPPIAAARVPGTGSAVSAGAATAGTGTGAGGSGTGRGGGGTGPGSGGGGQFTGAQKVTSIPNREYRALVALSGRRTGRVGLTLKVNTDGSPSDCRIARSSGHPGADSLMCQLALRYVRFRPARDPNGRPVAQDITWYPDWAPN